MIYSVDVRIEAPVRDTEVTDRVKDAISNIFPAVEVESEPGRLVGESHELERFSQRLHEQTILDTARREFAKRKDDEGFSFSLKKQAAFKGVVNFSVGSPDELGDIEVHVRVRDPSVDELIDHIAPPTKDGKPIDPADR
ncbi:RNA-binding domain-containing protein [Haloferax sp. DFSO60]|uniref:RNA-binding domain-containing protein n=1 Tax=Haloferax sp. DFSO60 TaxID=3388652 RepID=UPI00397C4DF7